MTAAPGWLDELSLGADGPPWLAMGLARLDPATWLLPDAARDAELVERHRLLAERHDEVFAALPGTEDAGAEVLERVRAWFADQRPDLAAALPLDPAGVHPLEAAGRLVQEDLCLMVARDGAHHLDAACLCFPSHWRLSDKFGRPAAEIHGPVPGYADELADRVDRYLDRLRPGVAAWRRNWSVHDSPDLFAPAPPAQPPEIGEAEVAERLWLRSERQTLRRLPRTGVVVFTIRVQQAPFAVLSARPDIARRLARRLRAQPGALSIMGGVAPHLEPALRWLDRLGAG